MSLSNLKSAITMGFFAAAIGLVVICYAALQQSAASEVNVNTENFASASAEDIVQP